MKRIGFIGIGKMGLPLAGHLRAAGHIVIVADRDPRRRDQGRKDGYMVEEPGRLAELSEVVFSSLPDDGALDAVSAVLCESARSGLVFVDTSTVSTEISQLVAQRCADAGVQYLRVALSGNNRMAEAAQLTVLASGPRGLYDSVLPLLSLFGRTQFYLGSEEQARLMKLVVNLMIVQTAAMLAEALTLGRKGGLAWEDMWQVIEASAIASPIIKAKAPALKRRDFSPTFSVAQMLKDMSLILDAGHTLHVPLPGTSATRELLHAAVASNWANEDYAAIIKVIEQLAGLTTRR